MVPPKTIPSDQRKAPRARREKKEEIRIQCEYRTHRSHQDLIVSLPGSVPLRRRGQWISAGQRCLHMPDIFMAIESLLTHMLSGRGRRKKRQCREIGRGKESIGKENTGKGSSETENLKEKEKENSTLIAKDRRQKQQFREMRCKESGIGEISRIAVEYTPLKGEGKNCWNENK